MSRSAGAGIRQFGEGSRVQKIPAARTTSGGLPAKPRLLGADRLTRPRSAAEGQRAVGFVTDINLLLHILHFFGSQQGGLQ